MNGTGDDLHARHVALDILHAVIGRRQPLDQVLEDMDSYNALSGRDRAFIRMMVATVLRRAGQIDDMIRRATDKNDMPQPPALHSLLRLAIAQIAFMEVPDYAVVDTAVRIAEENGLGRQKGFVNAVLRRCAREHRDWLARQDAATMNMPDWLLQMWIADYGVRMAAEIAQACLSEAPLDITVKNPGMTDYWTQELDAVALPTGSLRRPSGGLVYDLPGFDDGLWWIQDAAAALPARLFGDIRDKTVLDLCAAPGGKTAQLATQGAQVIALDRSAKRLQRLQNNMHRLRLEDHVTTEAADAAVWQPREKVPFILLDAPCTATGTIRRHPDALHLKAPGDLEKLAALQARILDNAATMLLPGGIMVYCTCSLQKAEGEAQVDAFLSRHKTMARLPVTADEIGGLATLLTPQGDVRILPFHLAAQGGMDGFYIARLVRNA